MYALVIIVSQFSSLFDQMHKTLDVGAIALDAFVITLSAVNSDWFERHFTWSKHLIGPFSYFIGSYL